MERRERERTGVANLKVGYNRVHGFYIEISKSQAEAAPAEYIRRQTLKGAERFVTPELKTFEDKVLSASERALRAKSNSTSSCSNGSGARSTRCSKPPPGSPRSTCS